MLIKLFSVGVLVTVGGCAALTTPASAPQLLDVPAAWSQANEQAAGANTSLVSWWLRFDDPLLGTLVNVRCWPTPAFKAHKLPCNRRVPCAT